MNNQNIAVIGTGYWGKNLVRNFFQLGALYAVCDQDVARATNIAKEYNCKALSWEQILTTQAISAVVIAAPAILHYQLAEQALFAGKHVFVEKPLALKVSEAKELGDLAKFKNLTLMVGHLLQYHPIFRQLYTIVQAGKLGRLQYIYSNRLNFGKIRREEDILWSFAPHDISMILSLVDEDPTEVVAVGSYCLHERIADSTTTHLKFPSGIRSHIFVSWLHPFKEQKLVVIGSKGMLVFDDGKAWKEKLAWYQHKIDWRQGLPEPDKAELIYVEVKQEEPLKLECQHFIDSVQNKSKPITCAQEGLRVLSVLDKATKSLLNYKSTSNKISNEVFVHATACIDTNVKIGVNTKIWHYSHVLADVSIGDNCVVGQNVCIGPRVVIGNNCKIQNNVSVYNGVTLEDGVFCGPSCVFTNVNNPRAAIEKKDEFRSTYVEQGATIGANATIVCGVRLGHYSFIGAGAVVTKNVAAYALMVGNPARQMGWVTRFGEPIKIKFGTSTTYTCPHTAESYLITANSCQLMQKEAIHEPS